MVPGLWLCSLAIAVRSISAASFMPLQRYLTKVATDLPDQLDERKCRCAISHFNGDYTEFAYLVELMEPKYIQFTEDIPKSGRLVEGRSLTLQCGANGIPPPKIHWRKNGHKLHLGPHENEDNLLEKLMNVGLLTLQNGITVSQLKLECATKDTEGVYECVAENGEERIVSPPALIEVETDEERDSVSDIQCAGAKRGSSAGSAPQIFMWTFSRLERGGASAELYCRARGNPQPKITWTNSVGEVLHNSDRFTILRNGDLVIKNVDWNLEGQYTCTASNDFGRDSVETYLYPTLAETDETAASDNAVVAY